MKYGQNTSWQNVSKWRDPFGLRHILHDPKFLKFGCTIHHFWQTIICCSRVSGWPSVGVLIYRWFFVWLPSHFGRRPGLPQPSPTMTMAVECNPHIYDSPSPASRISPPKYSPYLLPVYCQPNTLAQLLFQCRHHCQATMPGVVGIFHLGQFYFVAIFLT